MITQISRFMYKSLFWRAFFQFSFPWNDEIKQGMERELSICFTHLSLSQRRKVHETITVMSFPYSWTLKHNKHTPFHFTLGGSWGSRAWRLVNMFLIFFLLSLSVHICWSHPCSPSLDSFLSLPLGFFGTPFRPCFSPAGGPSSGLLGLNSMGLLDDFSSPMPPEFSNLG